MARGTIKTLILPNGNYGDFVFKVGEKAPITLGSAKVTRIAKNEDENGYIVFLDDGEEVDVLSNQIITLTKY